MHHIRLATAEDAPAVLGFIRALAAYEKLSHLCVVSVEQLRATVFAPQSSVRVLLVGESEAGIEKLAGFALCYYNYSTFLGKSGIYLEDLFVDPAYRGKGYGKALMVRLAQIAVDEGCGRFEWSVLDWNQPSIDFYRSIGAVGMDEWTVQRVSGEGLANLANLRLT